MSQGYLLKLLNIRKGEQKLVADLFLIEFFRGTAIAFFFTSAIKTFINHLSYPSLASGLPIVFIISSFFLWVTGYIYTKFEHKLSIQKLGTLIPGFMALSILCFWIIAKFIGGTWLWYIMLCWFNVLYLLNNLQFWSIASVIYDVRQSKRLFSVISAGDIPAKLIGYTLALWLIDDNLIETNNLLLISFGCMVLSIPFIYKISKSDTLKIHTHHKHTAVTVHSKYKYISLLRNYIGNKLIERIAILSFLFSFCYITIMYIFYGKVKIAMSHDHSLEEFIIIALVISKILSLIIMAAFTGRLMSRWGHRVSLALMPVTLAIIAIALLIGSYAGIGFKPLLYISAIMFLVTEALRYSVHSPVFLALMQPLPTSERLRAHNIVKGIMDPFAYLITGLILLIASHFVDNLASICYLLLVVMAAWFICILGVEKPYLEALMQSISRRSFNAEDISFADEASMKVIEQKMQTGSDAEKLYVLNLLENKIDMAEVKSVFKQALSDASPVIRKETIEIISSKKMKEFQDDFFQIIQKDSDPQVIASAIEGLEDSEVLSNKLLSFIDEQNEIIQESAIKKILLSHNNENKQKAEEKLNQLALSSQTKNRVTAAKILSVIHDDNSIQLLIKLMNDKDVFVSNAAIEAAGNNAEQALINHLLAMLMLKPKPILEALKEAGEPAVNSIKNYLLAEKPSENLTIKLIHLIARIEGTSSCSALMELMDLLPDYQQEIIKALHQSGFTASEGNISKVHQLIQAYIKQAEKISMLQRPLQLHHKKFSLLNHALQTELENSKQTLLNLFSFLYDRNKVNEIKLALYSTKKESIANAIELSEILISKEFASPFIRILESSETSTSYNQKTSFTIEDVCRNILENKDKFNKWTRAVCLFTIMKNDVVLNEPTIIQQYTQSPDLLLKEVALAAVKV